MQNLNPYVNPPTFSQPLLVAFSGFVLAWVLAPLARRFAYAHFTIVNDLPALGRPRRDGKLGQAAVVCGGSIAGLLSARVLSDHFEEVVVIDPDADVLVQRALAEDALRFPDGKDAGGPARPRVMQWTAYHLVQAIYFTALDHLFPSLHNELVAADCPVGPADINLHIGGVHLPMRDTTNVKATSTTLGLTRAAHETLVRRLVAKQCANVRFVAGTVLGVDPAADRKTLEAVRYRPTADARKVNTVKATLVLDCSGVASAGLGWLQRAGYPLAKEEIYESYHPHMRYTSCTFRIDPDILAKIKPAHLCTDSISLAFFFTVPGLDTRHFAVEHVEGNRVSIAAGGAGFDLKLTSVDELRAHVESIRQLKPMEPWVSALLDYLAGKPAETATYCDHQVSALHRMRYSKHAASLPSNFVALGDAIVRLNPVNGQGMAKAAVEVIALDGALRRLRGGRGALPVNFAARYFTRAAAITDRAWNTSKTRDYANDSCTPAIGESLDDVSRFGRLMAKLVGRRILSGDANIWRRASLINEWVMPTTEMMAPSVLVKLAWDLLGDVVSLRTS